MLRRYWLVALLLLVTLYSLVRGPWRAVHDSGDFLTIFSAARCWVHGVDPYVVKNLEQSARNAGAAFDADQFTITPSVYPPTTLLLLAPLALLPWAPAKIIWLLCSLAFAVWLGRMIIQQCRTRSPNLLVWLLLLSYAPLRAGLVKGQPTVTVCALIAASLAVSSDVLAGVLLGLALCLKPQLAWGFLLLNVGFRQWKRVGVVAATVAVISIPAIGVLQSGSFESLRANLTAVSSGAGVNSPSGPLSFQLLNIDTVMPHHLQGFPGDLSVYILVALLSALAIAKAQDPRMGWAIIASATILLGYHRFYDAVLLWLAIPATFHLLDRAAIIAKLGLCVFLVSGQFKLAQFFGYSSDSWTANLLFHHETFACVALWLVFIAQTRFGGLTSRPTSC